VTKEKEGASTGEESKGFAPNLLSRWEGITIKAQL